MLAAALRRPRIVSGSPSSSSARACGEATRSCTSPTATTRPRYAADSTGWTLASDPRLRGQLEVRDAHGTYLPDGTFDPDRMLGLVRAEHERVLADGYPGLSITGEMPVALCEAPAAGQLAVYESRLTRTISRARS
jgi:MEDS: MEthanogen/methylotroph, DcmR Sensory domain